MSSPVNIYSEFQTLEEIIVGRPYPASAFKQLEDPELRSMLQRIMEETEEDCQKLSEILSRHDVKVRRPEALFKLYEDREGEAKKLLFRGAGWAASYLTPPLWPRDLTLTLGNKILSVYSRSPGRWWEGQNFYKLFAEYYREGAEWVSMPPPLLQDDARSYADYESQALLFHAACFVRCGRDIFHTVPAHKDAAGRGTQMGLDWVKRNAPSELRFHEVNRVGHLDGKIAFLKPGLLMTWLKKEALPESLQSWDMIRLESKGSMPEEFHKLRKASPYQHFVKKWLTEWIGCVEETYFDVNIISISENLVVLNGHNPDLMRKLNAKGIECIPFDFRHRYFWDGGLHCITLDVRRKGGCEDYFQ